MMRGRVHSTKHVGCAASAAGRLRQSAGGRCARLPPSSARRRGEHGMPTDPGRPGGRRVPGGPIVGEPRCERRRAVKERPLADGSGGERACRLLAGSLHSHKKYLRAFRLRYSTLRPTLPRSHLGP
eukprot:scaffold926_cov408-Prasinococcus_capsulatus_cf.AAC.8